MKNKSVKVLMSIVLAVTLFVSVDCNRSKLEFNEVDTIENKVEKKLLDEKSEEMLPPCKKNIVFSGEWQTNPKLSYIAESFEHPTDYLENKVIFSILDSDGKIIYEQTFTRIESIYERNVLGNLSSASSELFLEVNYGGTDNFLKVLSFENGKVISLLEDLETRDEVQYSGLVNVNRQYNQSNKNSNKWTEPLQILIDDEDGKTQVFRYKNGKYRLYGKFEQKKIDEYIERIIEK